MTDNTVYVMRYPLIYHKYIYSNLRILDKPPMNNPQLTQEVSRLHADLCSALADPNRILMIYALAEKPRSVNELGEEVGLSQPATSRNLKVLRERGLVYTVRQGSTLEYHLADERLVEALNLLRTVLRDRLAYNATLMESTGEAG
jgi:DNA-binding transcriptional ArsR family regulator